MLQSGIKDRPHSCRGNWKYSWEQYRGCDSGHHDKSRISGKQEQGDWGVYVERKWEKEDLIQQGRQGVRLPLLTGLPDAALIHKLDSCCFSALEFCLKDHFHFSLTSQTLTDLYYFSPWSACHQKPFKWAFNIFVGFSASISANNGYIIAPIISSNWFFVEKNRISNEFSLFDFCLEF